MEKTKYIGSEERDAFFENGIIYREFFENTDQNFLMWEAVYDQKGDPYDLKLIDASSSFFKILNKPKEDLLGKTYREIAPDVDPHWLDFCLKIVLTGKTDQKELYSKLTNRHYSVSAFSLRKDFLGMIAHDITDRIKAVQGIKDREEWAKTRSLELEKVLDSVPAAVWIAHDPKALKITGNKYSYQWLDLPVGANASKSAPDGERPETFIILKDGRELSPEEMPVQVSARGQELRNFEFTLVYRDGSERHVLGNAVPIFNKKGDPTGSVSSFMDITDLKKANEALKESERRWATTLASIGDAVIATDNGGLVTFMNREAEAITGWKEKEVLNTPLQDVFQIINETDRRPAENLPKRTSRGKGNTSSEQILLVTRDGREIPIDYVETQIKIEEQRIIGEVIVFRDVTERRRAEDFMKNYSLNLEETVKIRTAELETAKERAESADRLKSAFLATMSHELRTPLNSIIGFSGILMREIPGPLNEEQKKQLGLIQSGGRTLLSLINDILDLSKIEAGQLSIHPEVFNLSEVLQEIVKLEAPHAGEKGISLNLIFTEDIDIESDRQRVHQIVLNLVNNAIKFTEAGAVTVSCNRETNAVILEVSDSGIGIEKENLTRLFSPFFQVENALTKTNKGSGLGLSICKKLVELLHGTITVVSEYEKGSTFKVSLPVSYFKN